MTTTEVFAVHNPPHAVLDVVFVHGLDGDARRTRSREDQQSRSGASPLAVNGSSE